MNAPDEWASYLDPDTEPELRDRLAARMAPSEPAALERIAEGLADRAAWEGPSPDLRSRLLAQAQQELNAGFDPAEQAEQAEHAEQTEKADRSNPAIPDHDVATPGSDAGTGGPALRSIDGGQPGEPASRRNRQARGRFGQGVLAGGGLVAAAAAVVFVVALGFPRNDTGDDITTFEVAGTELTPALDATADVEPLSAGVAITLNIKGLEGAGDGEYYAAWVMGDEGVVGVGTFHWREGGIPIELWSGVDTERYPMFFVTLQQEDEPPTPSDVVVMRSTFGTG